LALTLEAFEPPPRPVNLVYNSHARLPLKLRAFIDFVTPRLRDRLKAAAL
jgi:DNA-binding transcriptional LysR family regulator